jgi:hypothetical protein
MRTHMQSTMRTHIQQQHTCMRTHIQQQHTCSSRCWGTPIPHYADKHTHSSMRTHTPYSNMYSSMQTNIPVQQDARVLLQGEPRHPQLLVGLPNKNEHRGTAKSRTLSSLLSPIAPPFILCLVLCISSEKAAPEGVRPIDR